MQMTPFNAVKKELFFKDKEISLRQCLKDAVKAKTISEETKRK
jgi:hypothetical protein